MFISAYTARASSITEVRQGFKQQLEQKPQRSAAHWLSFTAQTHLPGVGQPMVPWAFTNH